ncbi:uncharacterized protein SCHCODRAFT_01201831 [Schizophyllum commune H4-8]|uniref:uncharacterized protein n=1 Tax=Schizophyllum commune (strain H4-8 / FGSC 9210) TaxID=578458 RepID=UPI0021609521|nr:uncharacterized protein SCHCODRAFT_01201831 [Schizophyllum commune H4-8]KAI5891383.1 hypothetical protein SCHCODRAFT_01201831 [Schizophyllum commune H4-8]
MGSLLDMDVDYDRPQSPSAGGSSAAYDAAAPSGSGAQNLPQVRARITVVCAECKRLKLKCDRKMPCGSCVKREATSKCQYSAAAAEKVDLQSLNNRLVQLEQYIAMSSGGQFSSTYPLAQVTGGASYAPHSCSHGPTPTSASFPFPALSQLLQASVDPVILTLPTRPLWTDWTWPTDIANAVQLPPVAHSSDGAQEVSTSTTDPFSCHRSDMTGTTSSAVTFIKQGDIGTGKLRAPANLVDALPVSDLLEALPAIFTTMRSYLPGFFHCEYGHARVVENLARTDDKRTAAKQKAKAQQIFFGNNPGRPVTKPPGFAPNDPLFSSFSANGADASPKKKAGQDDEWSLSFYAAACALMALSPNPGVDGLDADYWYAQSDQACHAWEQYCGTPSTKEGSNYVTSLLAQLSYCLTRADAAGASEVIHKAAMFFRTHHLTVGAKDEVATKNTKDVREKWMNDVWLDIIFWDAFVSDKMGQPPLISEGCVPAMENRESESPDFLVQRFRLASIVRLTKTRYWTLDALEAELAQFVTSVAEVSLDSFLPSTSSNAAKKKRARNLPDILGDPDKREEELHIQKMDLVLAAWQTLLAAYVPTLQHDHRMANPKWGGMVHAAHRVVKAATELLSYMLSGPSSSTKHCVPIAVGAGSATSCSFAPLAAMYPLQHTLFSAALVCGYGALKQPNTVWASGASEGVRDAHGAFSSPVILKLGDAIGESLGQREALQILDVILSKLHASSSGSRKRKHDEYMGAAADDAQPLASGNDASAEDGAQQSAAPLSERLARMGEAAKEKNGERPEKKKKRVLYPIIGIRVRAGSASRSTDASEVTASQSAPTYAMDLPAEATPSVAQQASASSSQQAPSLESLAHAFEELPQNPTASPVMPAYFGERPVSSSSLQFDARAIVDPSQFDPYDQQQQRMARGSTMPSPYVDNMSGTSQNVGVPHSNAFGDASQGQRSRRPSVSSTYNAGSYDAQSRAPYEVGHRSSSYETSRASYEPSFGSLVGSTSAVTSPYASTGSSGSVDGNSGSGSSSSATQMPPLQVPALPSPYGQPLPPVPPPQQPQQYYDALPAPSAYQSQQQAQQPQTQQSQQALQQTYAPATFDPAPYYQGQSASYQGSQASGSYNGAQASGSGGYDVKPTTAMLDAQARSEGYASQPRAEAYGSQSRQDAYSAARYDGPQTDSSSVYGDRGSAYDDRGWLPPPRTAHQQQSHQQPQHRPPPPSHHQPPQHPQPPDQYWNGGYSYNG